MGEGVMECQNCGYDPDDDLWQQEVIPQGTIEKFARYLKGHPAWGVFHLCLEDGNWNSLPDEEYCLEQGDRAAIKLIPLIRKMTELQREALAHEVDELVTARAARARKAKGKA